MNDELIKEYVNTGSINMCYAHYVNKSMLSLYSGKLADEMLQDTRNELDSCMAAVKILFREMEKDYVNTSTNKAIQ